jgi:hypothetical protein
MATATKSYHAELVGAMVLRSSCRGTVTSRYREALNVLLEEGLLLSLVAHRSQMTALSVLVPHLFRPPGGASVPEGSVLRRRPQGLVFAEAAAWRQESAVGGNGSRVAGPHIVLLAGAPRWSGRLEPGALRHLTPDRLPLLARALALRGRAGGLLGLVGLEGRGPGAAARGSGTPAEPGNPFQRRAEGLLQQLSVAGDPPLLRGLGKLVGLGPGFTPAGDDFLAGALLGEEALQRPRPRARGDAEDRPEGWPPGQLRAAREEIEAELPGTNAGGRTLLCQALRGRFPAYLLGAVRGIAQARSLEEMSRVVESAATHGETSGTDALAGLLWYLRLRLTRR